METLIVAEEHKNQYYEKKVSSRTFRQINCRAFESGARLLPRPKRTSSTTTTIITKGSLPQAQSPRSPKSVLPVFNDLPSFEINRTSPIPIANSRGYQIRRSSSEFVDKRRSLSYSELWAGPTYSNSPPPTSVPIPKFYLRQKKTVSLSFPAREVARSAPVSPISSGDYPFHSTVSATMTLRRMLNLENADE